MTGPIDVVVVGGGPAGASAATVLAGRGCSAVLVDKAVFPRDKFCGDGLTVWALRQLEALGWSPSGLPSFKVVEVANVGTPSGRLIELPLPDGPGIFAAAVRRHELDASVLDLAREAGAKVIDGTEVTGLVQTDDSVTVQLGNGERLQSRFVVAADGMWSPVRRFVGADVPGYRGDWHAFRQYFRNVSPRAASDMFAWFEPDFLPGYAWSFPVGGGAANVGFGILREGRWRVGSMSILWSELLARPHIRGVLGPDAEPEGPPRAWPIPCRIGAFPYASGRVLFAGDAIAAADPLTGEGIGQALATGRWAAEAIAAELLAGSRAPAGTGGGFGEAAGDGAARVRASYAHRIETDLVHDHAMAALLVRAMGHRKGARTALRLAGLTDWTRRNFARWLFEDYPRSIITTPRRWHRGILNGPGAFAGREGRVGDRNDR